MIQSTTARALVSSALMAALLFHPVDAAPTVATVHVFQGGSDGANPVGHIVIGPDGAIYGKTIENSSAVSVFRLDPSTGVNKSLFYGGVGISDDANSGVSFGANGAIYGASYFNAGAGQCAAGCGVIFQVNGATGAWSKIYQFLNDGDGRGTHSVIVGSGGALYGIADEGGADRQGSIFRLDPATESFETIYSFTGGLDGGSVDGVGVKFGSDGALYGEASSGGQYGYGTLFRFAPLAKVPKVLHQFTAADGNNQIFNTPPNLAISDNGSVYGTTISGGVYGKGMIFRLVPSTGALKVLHSFNGSDGNSPTRLVIGADGNLYGLTVYGGASNFGTIFEFNFGTAAFSSIYSFQNMSDGANPGAGGLTVSADGSIYGTTLSGGGTNGSGGGTVFKISF